ncbi:hypothetical protein MKW98_001608 [Papaver atlanticum]|uniref:Uncharacterized protein n=1 Tax=Papaver atlanticum TaxID=357466 RepID=A0AAD4S900_9MAGN|nr:hypothetical protein MKW98_001608 [Papaver atlanticum]
MSPVGQLQIDNWVVEIYKGMVDSYKFDGNFLSRMCSNDSKVESIFSLSLKVVALNSANFEASQAAICFPEPLYQCHVIPVRVIRSGCIYAEQLTIKPLFSVDNMVHQLERMIDFLGTPIESPGRNWIRHLLRHRRGNCCALRKGKAVRSCTRVLQGGPWCHSLILKRFSENKVRAKRTLQT